MSQPITASIPFGTITLSTTNTTHVLAARESGLGTIATMVCDIPSTVTVSLQTTKDDPNSPAATWATLVAGLTNQVDYRYPGPRQAGLRFLWTAGAGGVIKGTVSELSDYQLGTTTLPQSVQGNVGSGLADSGNPVKVGAKYNATTPLFVTGNRTDLQSDINGRLIVSDETTYTHIATATTTVVKATSCFLKCITVNTGAAGSASVYDNATGAGTVVAILDTSLAGNTFWFGDRLSTGCTVITTGTADLTVSAR